MIFLKIEAKHDTFISWKVTSIYFLFILIFRKKERIR
jgi:hypothetical protein